MAVVAMLRPMQTAKTRMIIELAMPTVAMASAPRRATKKTSTRPKVDSMTSSSTIGMASRAMARGRLPSV